MFGKTSLIWQVLLEISRSYIHSSEFQAIKRVESLRMLRDEPTKIQRFNFIRDFLINDVWVGFKFPNHIPHYPSWTLGKSLSRRASFRWALEAAFMLNGMVLVNAIIEREKPCVPRIHAELYYSVPQCFFVPLCESSSWLTQSIKEKTSLNISFGPSKKYTPASVWAFWLGWKTNFPTDAFNAQVGRRLPCL